MLPGRFLAKPKLVYKPGTSVYHSLYRWITDDNYGKNNPDKFLPVPVKWHQLHISYDSQRNKDTKGKMYHYRNPKARSCKRNGSFQPGY